MGPSLNRLACFSLLIGLCAAAAQAQAPPRAQLRHELVAPKATMTTAQTDRPVVVRVNPKNLKQIQRWDIGSDKTLALFTSPDRRIRDVEVAPDNEYVAVIETSTGVVEDGEYKVLPRNRLRVLDASGTTVCLVDRDVRAHSFSPDGAKIAFVEGSFYEGGVGFKPTGAFILDIKTCKSARIENVSSPYELNWLQTEDEDAVYMHVLDRAVPSRVMRYDVEKRRAERTTSSAIHFSPNGKYYLLKPHEAIQAGRCKAGRAGDTCLRVYERRTDTELKEFRSDKNGKPVGWIYNEGALLLFTKQQHRKVDQQSSRRKKTLRGKIASEVSEATNTLFDVQTKKEVEKFNGEVLGAKKRRGWVSGAGQVLLRMKPAGALRQESKSPNLMLRRAPILRASPSSKAVGTTRGLLRVSPVRMTLEPNTARTGSEYRSLDLEKARPELCEAACLRDQGCRAYTYWRPRGPNQGARCQLQSRVSQARPQRAAVSGVKIPSGAQRP